jgi:hypothetical protein
MTPKEKAEELITKYMISEDSNGWQDVRDVFAARRCALIAVDEIMTLINRSIEHFVPHFGGGGHTVKMPNQEYHYWQEVKKEIEAL